MNRNLKFLIVLSIILVSWTSRSQVEPSEGHAIDFNNVNMPASPTASALNAVENTNVNNATGVPSISIPLYSFELDGVSVPISLSYDATGVKVNQMATSVGLNWSLIAGGQVSRTVRAKPDEREGWFDPDHRPLTQDWYNSYDPNDAQPWQAAMRGTYVEHFEDGFARNNDHMPDQFNYTCLGYSGSFIYTFDSDVVKEKEDGLIIGGWGSPNANFEIKDLNGNTYDFLYSDSEKSNNIIFNSVNGDPPENVINWEGSDSYVPVTAWKLSDITTKNGKVIHFDYIDKQKTYRLNGVESHISLGGSCAGGPPVESIATTNIDYNYNTRLISRIWSTDGIIEVNFIYTDETGLANTVWDKKLTSIVISNSVTAKVKEFRFTYGRYNNDRRLKLKSVYEVSYDTSGNPVEKPPYVFTYFGDNSGNGWMPYKDSYEQDFFGYYNNASDPISLVPSRTGILPASAQQFHNQHSGDRTLNATAIKNGVLTDIQYPTGGSTHFEYEPNAIGDRYCGGLRVKSVENRDGGESFNKRTYEYADLVGVDLEEDFGHTVKTESSTTSYYSSFVSTPGQVNYGYKTGYFYGKVTVYTVAGTESHKEEFVYEPDPNSLHRNDYVLASSTLFKGAMPIKLVEYTNGLVGTPQYMSWLALGEMDCYINDSNLLSLGYTALAKRIEYRGNYAFLPTRIATTDFLKQGSGTKPVTTLQYIAYDGETLLKTQEITDTRYKRGSNGTLTLDDMDGEVLTTNYQYPFIPDDAGFPYDFPKGLLIKKEVSSNKGTAPIIFGQAMEYDMNGNIKRNYQYNKGTVGNTSPLEYLEDYELMTTFLFSNGKPVEVTATNGVTTSYIWAYKGQLPVAKIEGRSRQGINSTTLSDIENATYSNLQTRLTALRADPYLAGAMITTYTHEPLNGVKTITDPKGDFITYHYDALGRLEYVKDKDGNRLTENEYKYGSQ